MENTSLDEFRDSGENPTAQQDETPNKTGKAPTSRWRPGEAVCADCGETTTRLWHGDDGLVCGSCKNWA